jgi:hypothetical protein
MTSTNVITIGEIRFSHLHAFVAKRSKNSPDLKFSSAIMIPKKSVAIVDQIRKAIAAAVEIGIVKTWGGVKPNGMKSPLKDGDLPMGEDPKIIPEYAGYWILNATSKDQPNVVNTAREPITRQSEVYSGMWGYVNLSFFSYDKGKKGIGVGLNHIMKTKDDKPFSGRVDVGTAFANIDAPTVTNAGPDDDL